MSYRTNVNGVQLFGNNCYYEEWIEFIKSQGIEISEDGCYHGEITDFMGALEACEKIVLNIDTERTNELQRLREKHKNSDKETKNWFERHYSNIFDLSYIRKNIDEGNSYLFDELYNLIDCGYLFIPVLLYEVCKNDLEFDLTTTKRYFSFKVKQGHTIKVQAG